MIEKDLQRFVLAEMRATGWLCAHFGNTIKWVRRKDGYAVIPDRDGAGFPDIVAIRGVKLLVAELKSAKGRLRPEQVVWLEALRDVGVDVHIWRPDDWANGAIQEVLA